MVRKLGKVGEDETESWVRGLRPLNSPRKTHQQHLEAINQSQPSAHFHSPHRQALSSLCSGTRQSKHVLPLGMGLDFRLSPWVRASSMACAHAAPRNTTLRGALGLRFSQMWPLNLDSCRRSLTNNGAWEQTLEMASTFRCWPMCIQGLRQPRSYKGPSRSARMT